MAPFLQKGIMLRTISILSIATLLSACGGGASTTPAIDTRTPARLTPSLGDFCSYKEIYTTTGASTPTSTPYWYTAVVTDVEANGAWSETDVEESPSAPHMLEHVLADGDGDSSAKSGCTRSYQSTYNTSQRELVAGASWTRTMVAAVAGNCTGSPLTSAISNTTVLAMESVTVAAGTFQTAKVSLSSSYKYANGATLVDESTSWLDTNSRRLIKTSNIRTSTSASGKVGSSSTVAELQGYAQAGSGRSLLNVQRFAGGWSGSYAGPYSGSCTGQISPDGVLDASCGGGQFTLHGLIDANGNVTFSLSAGGGSGPSFSGKFDSPLSIQGTWSMPGGGAGTWQLNHI